MKTWHAKTDEIHKNWWLMDAKNYPLGRLASEAAGLLRGKHKPEFSPHKDTGDFVVVINAGHIGLTGKKRRNKKYFTHSGFFGSLKEKRAEELPAPILVSRAVSGMLPKNKMRKRLMKKLKVYENAEHPHQAQKPSAYLLQRQKESGKTKT